MNPRQQQGVSKFWFLFLFCALLPFCWALGFLYPRGDDFDYATRAMFFGPPNAVPAGGWTDSG